MKTSSLSKIIIVMLLAFILTPITTSFATPNHLTLPTSNIHYHVSGKIQLIDTEKTSVSISVYGDSLQQTIHYNQLISTPFGKAELLDDPTDSSSLLYSFDVPHGDFLLSVNNTTYSFTTESVELRVLDHGNYYIQSLPDILIDTREPTARDIVSITPIEPITVADGTFSTSLIDILPREVEVTLDDGSNHFLNVSWDISYSVLRTGQQITVIGNFLIDEAEENEGIFNSNNLFPAAEVSVATIEESASMIQSILGIPNLEIRAGTLGTVDTFGLPNEITAYLGNNTKVILEVEWDLDRYNPAIDHGHYVPLIGRLVNLPEGVRNPGYSITEYAFIYVDNEINTYTPIYSEVSNGAPKTAEGLGLPNNIVATLYNGTVVSVPVLWMVEESEYNPDDKMVQHIKIKGELYNLPDGVEKNKLNGVNASFVYASIYIAAANTEISSPPNILDITVRNGSPKNREGLLLPYRVEVNLANNTKIYTDVDWQLESIDYDPSSRLSQAFWVYGTLVNLPDYVLNPDNYQAMAYIVVEPQFDYITNIPWIEITVNHGSPGTVDGFGLPRQIEVFLNHNVKANVDVMWNMDSITNTYDPESRHSQSFYN